jgi:hypothetical protein
LHSWAYFSACTWTQVFPWIIEQTCTKSGPRSTEEVGILKDSFAEDFTVCLCSKSSEGSFKPASPCMKDASPHSDGMDGSCCFLKLPLLP